MPPELRGPLTLAFVCGTLPLSTGSAIFLLWCATGARWLELAGLLNILAGLIAILFGVGGLLAYCVTVARRGGLRRPRAWLAGLLAAGLLVLNFPACFTIIDTVSRLERGKSAEALLQWHSVTVVNIGKTSIDRVRVWGWGEEMEFGRLNAGESLTRGITQATIEAVTIRTTSGVQEKEVTTRPPRGIAWDGDAVAVIAPDGEIHVAWTRPGMNPSAD